MAVVTGGGHSWNTGPLPGGEEHYRDASHHGPGASPSCCPLHHGCLGAVWTQSTPAGGTICQSKSLEGLGVQGLNVIHDQRG